MVPVTDKYHDERLEERRARKDYHLRNIVMDEALTSRVFDWHGGQFTMTYSLASTGKGDLVSASMLDAAADELEVPSKHPVSAEDKEDCDDLIATLRDLADYPDEDTAERMGLYPHDSGYATWLMDANQDSQSSAQRRSSE